MKSITTALCVVALAAVGLAAQSQTTETKTKTKVEIKDGKDVTVRGCLAPNPSGGFMLTTTSGDLKYALITDDDLSKDVGHKIEVKGKAADRGDGKVKVESKVGTTGSETAKTTTEMKGDMSGMHLLGVKSIKTLSSSCM
jgi:hypothetical protein